MKVRRMLLEKFGKKFPMECQQNGCINPKVCFPYFDFKREAVEKSGWKKKPI